MTTRSPGSSSSGTSSDSDSFVVVAGAAYHWVRTKFTGKRRRKSYVQRLLPSRHTVSFDDITRALGPDLFRKSYRMSEAAFALLLNEVQDLIDKPFKAATEYRRSTVPPAVRLGITLRILAGASYLDLVLAYQVAESTLHEVFNSTCEALMTRLRLKGFPTSSAGLRSIAKRFQTSRKSVNPLSGCVGAVDGICVKIKKPEPQENPAMFYCRKGFYAIPVQALVDSDYIFRFCSAICTGSTHDSLAFSVSGLKREIDKGILGTCYYIVGDEAYSCTEHIITPFSKSGADTDQDNFNFFLSSLRMHVEQAFGMLVARWRILRGGLEFSVNKSTNLICLLMKLHNFVLENDRERSVLTHQLTDYEKQVLEADINQWCQESRQLAREFQGRYERDCCSHDGTLLPVRNGSNSRKRDRLVQIVKEKGRERPEVPLHHYSVDHERM